MKRWNKRGLKKLIIEKYLTHKCSLLSSYSIRAYYTVEKLRSVSIQITIKEKGPQRNIKTLHSDERFLTRGISNNPKTLRLGTTENASNISTEETCKKNIFRWRESRLQ